MVFIYYLKSLGWVSAIMLLLSKIAIEGCSIGTNLWLVEWSSLVNATSSTRDLYLGVYGAIGAGKALASLGGSFLLAFAAIHGSRLLHSSMLHNVFKSPVSFFETNPLGRIVNRFSKDIFIIDEVIPVVLDSFLRMACSVLGIIIIICVSTPLFMTVILPLAVIYILTQVKVVLINDINSKEEEIFIDTSSFIAILCSNFATTQTHRICYAFASLFSFRRNSSRC